MSRRSGAIQGVVTWEYALAQTTYRSLDANQVDMSISVATHRTKKVTHIARIMSPYGNYPADSLTFESGCGYFADNDVAFSVVPRIPEDEDEPYTEMKWLDDLEIRVYLSFMLAVDREIGYISFYPYYSPVCLACDSLPESARGFIKSVKPILIEQLTPPDTDDIRELAMSPSSRLRQSDTIPPPVIGGRDYDFRSDGLDLDMAREIFAAIDTKDAILIRGLTTLLRAGMLKNHFQFYEEGINTLFISLEASFRLVIRRLKADGNPEPTAADAAIFLHDTFNDVHRLENYLKRIMSGESFRFIQKVDSAPIRPPHFLLTTSIFCSMTCLRFIASY